MGTLHISQRLMGLLPKTKALILSSKTMKTHYSIHRNTLSSNLLQTIWLNKRKISNRRRRRRSRRGRKRRGWRSKSKKRKKRCSTLTTWSNTTSLSNNSSLCLVLLSICSSNSNYNRSSSTCSQWTCSNTSTLTTWWEINTFSQCLICTQWTLWWVKWGVTSLRWESCKTHKCTITSSNQTWATQLLKIIGRIIII